MITKAALVAWILALPVVRDGHGMPIPRSSVVVDAIADAALETELPQIFAAHLDVLGAHESAYRTIAVGDGGRSCGIFQTPCTRTPHDALGQARLAIKILRVAIDGCFEHPIWMYAAGRCVRSNIAAKYEREVRAELAIPFEVTP